VRARVDLVLVFLAEKVHAAPVGHEIRHKVPEGERESVWAFAGVCV
jgi:hypothetical protein